MKKTYLLTFLIVHILLIACNGKKEEVIETPDIPESVYLFGICIDSLEVNEYEVKQGDNLSAIYAKFGFAGNTIDKIIKSSAASLNPKSLRSGMSYYSFITKDTLAAVQYMVFARSLTDFVKIDFTQSDTILTSVFKKPICIETKYAEGLVESNLWNSIVNQGVDPLLAMKLSDIYAWQIDFFGVQKGDGFKVIYKEAFVDDSISLNIQSIEGAVFHHNNKDYYAIPFEQDSVRTFFDAEGNSTKRAFLKAPLDFIRISSHFSNARFHPVLKRYRPHHGVDYAAPVGTPVKTIGDGLVVEKGFQRNGAGNYLKIKHNSTYTTTYMHLSKFAKGIEKGTRVQQGDIIAYVGSTGLSTGPHLDFRVHQNGKAINPLTMESPPDIPVAEELKDSFMRVKERFLNEIDSLSLLKQKNDSLFLLMDSIN